MQWCLEDDLLKVGSIAEFHVRLTLHLPNIDEVLDSSQEFGRSSPLQGHLEEAVVQQEVVYPVLVAPEAGPLVSQGLAVGEVLGTDAGDEAWTDVEIVDVPGIDLRPGAVVADVPGLLVL